MTRKKEEKKKKENVVGHWRTSVSLASAVDDKLFLWTVHMKIASSALFETEWIAEGRGILSCSLFEDIAMRDVSLSDIAMRVFLFQISSWGCFSLRHRHEGVSLSDIVMRVLLSQTSSWGCFSLRHRHEGSFPLRHRWLRVKHQLIYSQTSPWGCLSLRHRHEGCFSLGYRHEGVPLSSWFFFFFFSLSLS